MIELRECETLAPRVLPGERGRGVGATIPGRS